ncbi:hypothetical protein BU24DRAFT_410306 [Aaosphaeria arxii CBS 175.79]|uniref:Uncharacterized protein n=1 Tax=Aaosphaeria arxii CBS 175.79 TaxID=1450172 RepID=A0A6A5XPB4_9PLEO|nr:uncharacterized protein BU24DRAFT_410306 [Aaosphaeria arxii CBS 175.79]KAF2014570.1 hypothetical protein BU24DRAFT_410306 [Aaosphaeria arxii CBS 175.79]
MTLKSEFNMSLDSIIDPVPKPSPDMSLDSILNPVPYSVQAPCLKLNLLLTPAPNLPPSSAVSLPSPSPSRSSSTLGVPSGSAPNIPPIAALRLPSPSKSAVNLQPIATLDLPSPFSSVLSQPSSSALGQPSNSALGQPSSSALGQPSSSALGQPSSSALGLQPVSRFNIPSNSVLDQRPNSIQPYRDMTRIDESRSEAGCGTHSHHFRGEPCCTWGPRTLFLCGQASKKPLTKLFIDHDFLSDEDVASLARAKLRGTYDIVLKLDESRSLKIVLCFSTFLESISTPQENAYDLISILSFPHFYISKKTKLPNQDTSLMRRCRKLKIVQLAFDFDSLTQRESTNRRIRKPRERDAFISHYGFSNILDCQNLKLISFHVIRPKKAQLHFYKHMEVEHKTLLEAAAWIGQKFENNGRHIQILISFRGHDEQMQGSEKQIWPVPCPTESAGSVLPRSIEPQLTSSEC